MVSAVPYFADRNIWWTVCVLPTFWMGEEMKERSAFFLLIGFLLSLLWLSAALFYSMRKGNRS